MADDNDTRGRVALRRVLSEMLRLR